MRFFVQESAAKLTPFYLFKNSFSKILFFLQIMSPIWPCAILCARAILCAPTVYYKDTVQSELHGTDRPTQSFNDVIAIPNQQFELSLAV